jgi:hypothetical protein
VFDEATVAFLHSGCALIIGTVDADGQPHAGRGWGLDLLPPEDPRTPGAGAAAHLVIDADDTVTIANLVAGGAVAVTATSVRTLHSLQMKGRAIDVGIATPEDQARAARFCDEFVGDIVETDHSDPDVTRRMTPSGYATCSFTIEEVYDQTPGPKAGTPMSGPRGRAG